MTKKRSRNLFIVFAIVLVVCLIACFVNFTYPFAIGGNIYSYSNFVSNLRPGEDLGNSVRIVYEIAKEEGETVSENSKLSTIQGLQEIARKQGFQDATITEYGENGLVLTVGNVLSKQDKDEIISVVGSPKRIHFSTSSSKDDAFADSNIISSVDASELYSETGETVYGVVIRFTEQGRDKMISKSQDGDIHMLVGEQNITISKGNFTSDRDYVTLSDESLKSKEEAEKSLANQIRAGMLALELNQIDAEMISPSLGRNAGVLMGVSILVAVVIMFALMIWRYKHLGWISAFAMLFFTVIDLFLLQSIPLVTINFGGVVGLMLAYILLAEGMMTIFENAKQHYQSNTKLFVALKLSQKESMPKLLISSILSMALGFVCLFMPTLSVKSFGWVMFVSSFVIILVNLAMMRLFIKMYLPFNSENGAKCNFHKGGKNA